MKSIYTNENPRLKEFSELLNSDAFMHHLKSNVDRMQEYSWGSKRVMVGKARDEINSFLRPHQMLVTTEVEHAHNIGNNNRFYVRDLESSELFACLSLNDDMFGRVYCYGTDTEDKIISNTYHMGGYDKLLITNHHTPDWSQYAFYQENTDREDAMESIHKKVVLTIRVPADFDHEDERMLDDEFANLLSMQGWELIESSEYETIKEPLDFVFDEELCVQDEHCECVDGYLWATDSLVNRARAEARETFPLKAHLTMDHFNFYPVYNLNEGMIRIICTFDYSDEKNMHDFMDLKLSESEQQDLIRAMDLYCEQKEHCCCLSFVNQARVHEGLPPIELSLSHPHIGEQSASLEAMLNHAESNSSEKSNLSVGQTEEKERS